ncbi:hypothetical protein HK405_004462, partial [Cladochytrium tenue]
METAIAPAIAAIEADHDTVAIGEGESPAQRRPSFKKPRAPRRSSASSARSRRDSYDAGDDAERAPQDPGAPSSASPRRLNAVAGGNRETSPAYAPPRLLDRSKSLNYGHSAGVAVGVAAAADGPEA